MCLLERSILLLRPRLLLGEAAHLLVLAALLRGLHALHVQELRVPGLLEPMPVRELCPSPVHENRRIFNFRQLVLGCIKTKFSNSVCSFFKLYTIVPMPFPEF